MLSILGGVSEFERSLIRERQREVIAVAKARGVYAGRKRTPRRARIITDAMWTTIANGFRALLDNSPITLVHVTESVRPYQAAQRRQ
jgi:DNA invertase Pin-like site-specific DNA recombinase